MTTYNNTDQATKQHTDGGYDDHVLYGARVCRVSACVCVLCNTVTRA